MPECFLSKRLISETYYFIQFSSSSLKYSHYFLFGECLSKNYSYLFWNIKLAEIQFGLVFCNSFSAFSHDRKNEHVDRFSVLRKSQHSFSNKMSCLKLEFLKASTSRWARKAQFIQFYQKLLNDFLIKGSWMLYFCSSVIPE